MTDAQARSVVAAVALVLLTAIGALALGFSTALLLTLAVGYLWLLWDRVAVHERVDVTDDRSDLALEKAKAIENHLTGLEPPGTGKHAPTLERSQA